MTRQMLALLNQQNIGPRYLISDVAVGTGTSTVIGPPAGYDTGGLLVAIYVQDAREALTVSAGWTLHFERNRGLGTDRGMAMLSRSADGTADDTLTLTHGTANSRGLCVSFVAGATVVDTNWRTEIEGTILPSNAGAMSGAAGDYALYFISQQTSAATITDYPAGTYPYTHIGPIDCGTESFAAAIEKLADTPNTGDWTVGSVVNDRRWISGTFIVRLS